MAYALLLWAAVQIVTAAPIDSHYDKTCTNSECHPVRFDDPSVISHPSFLEEWCDRCHVDHSSSNEGLLIEDPGALCLQCHAETETREHTVLHPPNAGNCVECHSPHQSSVRHLLREEEMLLQCASCHEEDLRKAAEMPFAHRFFSPRTECASCHYAHREGEGAFVRENLGETCLTCHDMNIMGRSRPLENVGQAIRTAPFVHDPLHDDACHVCHTTHGSMQSSLLRDNYPAGNYARYEAENYSLCWSCHDPNLVEMAETREATGFRDGSQNLHHLHVFQFDRGRACHLCHTAHASQRPHLLRETILFGSWESDFQFEVLADGGNCTTACHRPAAYSRINP